jgi:hypothetical protein
MAKTDFLDLAKQAYDASSAYLDTNYRADWDYSLRAFRNEHAAGSKYLSPDYAARSRLFRPKTRSIIRKNEAAGAVALFSNMEVINVTAGNPDDPMSVASAAALKEILEYRLSKTLKSFPLVMGALQDAQTTGAVVSYQYWEYETRGGRKTKDKPCIELRPIENIRLDGGASWLDPVESTPYFSDIIPMYVCQVRRMMELEDNKIGAAKWKKYPDSVILRAKPDIMDTLNKARLGKQQDPQLENSEIKDFDIIWVMRWFMRDPIGDDYTYYTLGTEELLTDAKPLEEVYFHGKRPYVMGYSILETHKAFKTGVPMLIKPLQQETNQLQNARLDNVQFVLNKRWIVARGRQVDVQSLVRNVPGGVTLATDPKNDVQESNWPDVTSSAYVEQDRINSDLDELAGNFSPSTKVANNAVNDTLGGSRMASQGAGLMSDYLLRTFIETWYEPMLRQLVLLEQYYETDETVLAVCANKARLFPRFGLSRITDYMLTQEINVSVNVGMGATNPSERFQKLLVGTEQVMKIVMTAPPDFNVQEFVKEAYSNMGYRDGARFWGQGDPRLAKAMQIVQQLKAQVEGKQMEQQAAAQIEQQKLLSNERIASAKLTVDRGRINGDLQIRAAESSLEQQRLALDKLKIQIEAQIQLEVAEIKARAQLQSDQIGAANDAVAAGQKLEEHQMKLNIERQKLLGVAAKIAADIEKAKIQLAQAKSEHNTAVAQGAMDTIGKTAKSIAAIGDAMSGHLGGLHGEMQKLGEGIIASLPKEKAKPSKLTVRKQDGKTSGVQIDYHDGTSEVLPVEAA